MASQPAPPLSAPITPVHDSSATSSATHAPGLQSSPVPTIILLDTTRVTLSPYAGEYFNI
jgi:hypothetical protein